MGETIEQFKPFLDASGIQTKMITDVCVAGVAAVIFTLLRNYRVLTDHAQLARFTLPLLLFIPLLGFVVGILAGYFVTATGSGFSLEAALGEDLTKRVPIDNLREYFKSNYQNTLYNAGRIQIVASLLGIVTIVTWYAFNILKLRISQAGEK